MNASDEDVENLIEYDALSPEGYELDDAALAEGEFLEEHIEILPDDQDVVSELIVEKVEPVAEEEDAPAVAPVPIRKGPRRFLLFDNLIAEVVDYDKEDGSPIVEFEMSTAEADEEKLPVECGICPDVMHKSKLDKHIRKHIKPGTKRFVCIYCDENFVSRAYAAGHARRHMGIRPYVCVPCKLYYCTKQDLRVHQQRRHWAKEHICEQCGKTFAQNTSLKNHRTLVHEQQRRFECEHCGKRFLRNYAMKEHVRNVHMRDRRPLDCPFCDECFRDTHKLAQHRKEMHLNQENFECRECGLKFSSIDFFDAHRRSLQCRKKYQERKEQFQTIANEPVEAPSYILSTPLEEEFIDELELDNVNAQVINEETTQFVDIRDAEIVYEFMVDGSLTSG